MRKSWRDLENDFDVHVEDSEKKSSDLESRLIKIDNDVTGEISELRREFSEFRQDIKPALEVFTSAKVVNRMLRWSLAVGAAIVAIVVGIKNILK